MTGPGLEQALARISTEVTEEAAYRRATAAGKLAAPVRHWAESYRDRNDLAWRVRPSISSRHSKSARAHG